MIGLPLTLIVAGAGFWLSQRPPQAELPILDLSGVDAPTATTIKTHWNAVQAQPHSGPAWGWLGSLLRVYQFPDEASLCLTEAERLDPDNPRWPYFQSLLLATLAPEVAMEKARRAAQLCGNDPEMPRYRLAKLLAEEGNWEEARKELEQLVAAKPGFTPALMLLAHEAQTRADFTEAIRLAQACTNDAYTVRSAWSLLAMLYRRTGDISAADQAAQQSAQLPADPILPDPYESELAQRRGDTQNLTLVCHDLLAQGKLDRATPLIENLVKNHSGFAETWLLLGRLQILRKQFAEAEQSLHRHLQLSPRSIQGIFQLGTALLSQRRFTEAAEQFAKAFTLKPNFGPAYYNHAFAIAQAGKPREAIHSFHESLKHNPEHLETYFLTAELHLRLGEKQDALELLQFAEMLAPDDPRLKKLREWSRALPKNPPDPTPGQSQNPDTKPSQPR